MFWPSVVNCFSCISLTFPLGYKTNTRMPGTPKNPFATALPVSPDVATKTLTYFSPFLRMKCPNRRAIKRPPTSLNANVGP